MITFKQFLNEAPRERDPNDPFDSKFIRALQAQVNIHTRGAANLEVEKHWKDEIELYMVDADEGTDPDDDDDDVEYNAFSVHLDIVDGNLEIDTGSDDDRIKLNGRNLHDETVVAKLGKLLANHWERYVEYVSHDSPGGVSNRSMYTTQIEHEVKEIGAAKLREIKFNGSISVAQKKQSKGSDKFTINIIVYDDDKKYDISRLIDDDDNPEVAELKAKIEARKKSKQLTIDEARDIVFKEIAKQIKAKHHDVTTKVEEPTGQREFPWLVVSGILRKD